MFGQTTPIVGESLSADRHDGDAGLPDGAVPVAPGTTSSRNWPGLDEDYKFTPRLFVPTIADGPKPTDIQRCLDGMRIVCRDVEGDFVDSEGNYIRIPRRDGDDPSSKQILGLPYARVFWEMARGNLLLGVDGETMYRRDRDDTGANAKLTGFHAIADLREGFGIDSKQTIKGMDRLARIMLAGQSGRVQHGVRFRDCAFLRDRTGALDVGTVKRIGPDDDRFAQPFEVSFDCGFDQKLADQARDWLKFVTAGEHSAMNLARMFACPLLEPFKSLSFLCYGQGGNGKGLLASALMSDPVTSSLAVGVDAHSLLGGPGVNQFATQQAAFRIIGTLWAIDQDADTVRLEQMTNLKKISTGDQQVGRLIGENSVVFAPRCTLVLMTNNPVIMPDTEALRRRQVPIRMKEGHTREQFLPLVRFIREHGAAPFMMVSCQLWEQHGDAPFTDVEIGDAATLTDHEQWIVDEIVKHGYAVTGENPCRVSEGEHRNSVAKLGLVSKVKKIQGKPVRILTVGNQRKFHPYGSASEAAMATAEHESNSQDRAQADVLRAFLASADPKHQGVSLNRLAAAIGETVLDTQRILNTCFEPAELVKTGGGYALAD